MINKFRWGYIGCGSIAFTTAKEVIKTEDNEIYGAWNRSKEKALKFAKKFKCKVYENVEDLLEDPNIDGVYINLTANCHYEYMKKCIAYHKPVLCEKPLTVNAEEAKEIFALAKQENVYVSEAMWTWYNKPAIQVKKWIEENRIGDILSVTSEIHFPIIITNKESRLLDLNRIGGALLDIGIYPLRYTLELFGKPNRFECKGKVIDGVDHSEVIDFYYDDFVVHHDIAMDALFSDYYLIEGSEGQIKVPKFHMTKKAILKGKQKDKVMIKDDLYASMFSKVAKEIRNGFIESEYSKPEKTIECMEIMDECRKMLKVVYPSEIKD